MIAKVKELIESSSLCCPSCRNSLKVQANDLQCESCDKVYHFREGIPVFTPKTEYWCNVDKEKMQALIDEAESTNDWVSAVDKLIPEYAPAVKPLYRADAQFLFRCNSNSRILDAGSMWGGLTIPIAQYCREIYAVDKTWETLRFLQTRAQQMQLNNVKPIVSGIHTLPFPDNYFDFIVVNGVLEWLGMSQDIILEEHWRGKRKDSKEYESSPTAMQLTALRELYRVLKPGGGIYIAIENRIGLQYFCSHPDDHMNVRFVTFMPRWFANMVTKWVRKTEYRTYVYTPKQLQALLNTADFKNTELYSAYPHYGKLARLTPFAIFAGQKAKAIEGYPNIKVYMLSKLWRLIPNPLCKFLSPSICITASKSEAYDLQPRLLDLLVKSNIIKAGSENAYKLMLVNNRFGNHHTTNYYVINNGTQKVEYFCKIARNKSDKLLQLESEQHKKLAGLLAETKLIQSIPKLIFANEIDGIHIQITQFINAKNVGKNISEGLRRLPKFIPSKASILKPIYSRISQYGSNRWLEENDSYITQAITWLTQFQVATQSGNFKIATDASAWLAKMTANIADNGLLNDFVRKKLNTLSTILENLGDDSIPLCMQHGDFDICNLLFREQQIYVIDFEHIEENALPFFDLANLIYSPLLAEWRDNDSEMNLKDYAATTRWQAYLDKWLAYYEENTTGISPQLLKLLPVFAVIEQNAKSYPVNRDPHDYPMFGEKSLHALLDWVL